MGRGAGKMLPELSGEIKKDDLAQPLTKQKLKGDRRAFYKYASRKGNTRE